jgi:hypothetical protein
MELMFITMYTRATTGPILSQMNPVDILPPYALKICFDIILPYMLRSSEWPLPLQAFQPNFA